MIVKLDEVILDERARGEWCRLPYPNHPHGCPNYGERESCPPFAERFEDLVEPPFYLVIQEFDIEAQEERMRSRHPDWTRRQCRNLLYWQRGVVKKLKEKAYDLADSLGEEFIVLEVPEANGVDLFSTCRKHDIPIERNPQKTVRKMMIVGRRQTSSSRIPREG